MPIRPEHRWLYPIDWRELSNLIRFTRAKGRCEHCSRPHGKTVLHLGDGRWWDAERGSWRDGRGRRARARMGNILALVRSTRVWLACAHLNHDPTCSAQHNLAALCQRCHMIHDAPEHRWRRWWNAYKRRAIGDLFADNLATLVLRSRSGKRAAQLILNTVDPVGATETLQRTRCLYPPWRKVRQHANAQPHLGSACRAADEVEPPFFFVDTAMYHVERGVLVKS